MQWIFHPRKGLNMTFQCLELSLICLLDIGQRKEQVVDKSRPSPKYFSFFPGSESLKLMLRLWNTCLVEDGGGASSHTRNKAGVTPCGFPGAGKPPLNSCLLHPCIIFTLLLPFDLCVLKTFCWVLGSEDNWDIKTWAYSWQWPDSALYHCNSSWHNVCLDF